MHGSLHSIKHAISLTWTAAAIAVGNSSCTWLHDYSAWLRVAAHTHIYILVICTCFSSFICTYPLICPTRNRGTTWCRPQLIIQRKRPCGLSMRSFKVNDLLLNFVSAPWMVSGWLHTHIHTNMHNCMHIFSFHSTFLSPMIALFAVLYQFAICVWKLSKQLLTSRPTCARHIRQNYQLTDWQANWVSLTHVHWSLFIYYLVPSSHIQRAYHKLLNFFACVRVSLNTSCRHLLPLCHFYKYVWEFLQISFANFCT